jgi:hypothetical protein
VTEKNVTGTYIDQNSKKIIINSDKSASIEIEVVDTVLTVFKNNVAVNATWTLKKNMLYFNISVPKYKYLEQNHYEVNRKFFKKIIWTWGPGYDKSNYNKYQKLTRRK